VPDEELGVCIGRAMEQFESYLPAADIRLSTGRARPHRRDRRVGRQPRRRQQARPRAPRWGAPPL